MVQFLPLDVTDEDSVGVVLSHLDNAIQYGEHEEPKEPADVSSGRGRRPLLLASEGSVRSRLPVRARGCKVLSVDSLVPRRWTMATSTRANEQSSLADRWQRERYATRLTCARRAARLAPFCLSLPSWPLACCNNIPRSQYIFRFPKLRGCRREREFFCVEARAMSWVSVAPLGCIQAHLRELYSVRLLSRAPLSPSKPHSRLLQRRATPALPLSPPLSSRF